MIDANQYVMRQMSVIEQFRLARRMVSTFSASGGELAAIVNEESATLRDQLERLSVSEVPAEIIQRREELVERYTEQLQADLPGRIGRVSNRLNQNETILLVAVFEAQMKDIHREVLKQQPALLKSDRMVPLGRIVTVGQDAIVTEEIEREVEALDRKTASERAKYFEQRLGIDWFGGHFLPIINKALELRNRVLHEEPDLQISDADVDTVRWITFVLPYYCCLKASERYPAGFPGWISKPLSTEASKHGA